MDESHNSDHGLGTDLAGQLVSIQDTDLLKHVLIVGGAGMGKSSAMKVIARSQVEKNRPVVVFDAQRALFDYVFATLAAKQDFHTLLVDENDSNCPQLRWSERELLVDRFNFLVSVQDPATISLRLERFLLAASTVKSPVPQYVFVDGLSTFMTRRIALLLPQLTEQGYGVIGAASYEELAAIKRADRDEIYRRGLFHYMTSIIAFGGNSSDPPDVIIDVAKRLGELPDQTPPA